MTASEKALSVRELISKMNNESQEPVLSWFLILNLTSQHLYNLYNFVFTSILMDQHR